MCKQHGHHSPRTSVTPTSWPRAAVDGSEDLENVCVVHLQTRVISCELLSGFAMRVKCCSRNVYTRPRIR